MLLPWELIDQIVQHLRPDRVCIPLDEKEIEASQIPYDETVLVEGIELRRTLALLCRTCHHLHAVCMPLLYEAVQFPVLAFDGETVSTAYMFPSPVLRLFKRKPHVARMVKHVNLFFNLTERDDSLSCAMYFDDFAKLCKNVESVTVKSRNSHLVAPDLLAKLAAHGRLRSFHVWQVPSYDPHGFDKLWTSAGAIATLKHIKVEGSGIQVGVWYGEQRSRGPLPPAGPSFQLDSYEGPVSFWPLAFCSADHELAAWLLQNSRETLRTLKWTWVYPHLELAPAFPQVEHLELTFDLALKPIEVDHVIEYLTSLPKLRSLALACARNYEKEEWIDELLRQLPRTIRTLDLTGLQHVELAAATVTHLRSRLTLLLS